MAQNKPWGGRFKRPTSKLVEDYTQSVDFDRYLFKQDIIGSKAHAKSLAKAGIINQDELNLLLKGLDQIAQEIEQGEFKWRRELEDVHMNIEARLIELVGDVGKKLHTARSRNDQVALDFRLFVAERLKSWQKALLEVINSLLIQAEQNVQTLLPGFTHLQPAQPISLAQHLLAYAWMLKRDFERIQDCLVRVEVSPLGAAALAGSTYALDPNWVKDELGLGQAFANSMDAVADRDFVLEALFVGSVVQMHLSRWCAEIILWANPCFGFVSLPDEFATGSSIMPQKKNPDVAELMRGKTGRVYGNLIALLTILKGLVLTYNRDLQEDKEPFLDTDKTVFASLQLMAEMTLQLKFNSEKMLQTLKKGYLNATELADYLVSKGIPFREAHHLTGQLVSLAEEKKVGLEELSLEEMQTVCPQIEEDVYNVLDYFQAVKRRNISGGTGFESIANQLSELKKWQAEQKKTLT